ncbi:hypothetical protein GWI33_012137 [Rhynchophorus ferrugineus]|uniref:Endonuclease/exonuclease/phosphatase domain-containing protein n=1 Tax=Rhynchophorus ferrugineus TaxID=354439 RepID=A0A834I606_RHYFE|nr:hypothetical protein GWI33_012137 [Rhynchophorus ferrugineus]
MSGPDKVIVKLLDCDLLITNVYAHQTGDNINCLEEKEEQWQKYQKKWIVAGDFNAKHALCLLYNNKEGKPQRNKTSKKKFDYHGTSWQRVTDGLLVASTEIRATMQIDEIEKQAEQMQAAFKKSTKLLKTTTIIIKQDNE